MYNKKNKFLINIFAVIILAFIINGCSGEQKKEPSSEDKDSAVYAGSLKTINDKDLAEIIKNRNGKVLFLNLWATWCEPCVEEFPDIVKLDKNYKDIEIIALSVDMPSDINDKIIPFLKEQGAEFKVYIADEKSSEKIIELLNPEWSGAVPATFIFDESGNQQKFLLGLQTYNDMASGVDSVKSL